MGVNAGFYACRGGGEWAKGESECIRSEGSE